MCDKRVHQECLRDTPVPAHANQVCHGYHLMFVEEGAQVRWCL